MPDEETGLRYRVHRPEDGLVIDLTCTPQQLEETWIPAGYRVADDGDAPTAAPIAEPTLAAQEPQEAAPAADQDAPE